MKNRIPLALAAALMFLNPAPAVSQDELQDADLACDALPDNLSRTLDEFMAGAEKKGFSGILLVAKDGVPIFHKGFGLADRAGNIPFGPDTVFDTGSVTKQFTAAGIMKLVETGRVSTGDTLERYFSKVPEDKKGIKIHQLLTHTSGLPGGIGFDYAAISRAEYVDLALASPLEFAPGTGWAYSNVGYSLLAAIIEITSGQGYEAFLYENLFKPAGMELTGYARPDWQGKIIAHGYQEGKDWGTPLEKLEDLDWKVWHLYGNGGILSTTGDMLKWHTALMGDKILSRDSVALLQTPHVSEGGDTYYGYGWGVGTTPCGGRLIHHNGGNPFFKNDFWRLIDQDLMIYASSNSSKVNAIHLVSRIGDIVLGMEPEPFPNWVEMSTFPKTPYGQRAEGFLEAVQNMPVEDLAAFVADNFSAKFLERVPVENLVQIFMELRPDFEGAHLLAVDLTVPFEAAYKFQTSWGSQIVLKLFIEENAPHLIFGITLD